MAELAVTECARKMPTLGGNAYMIKYILTCGRGGRSSQRIERLGTHATTNILPRLSGGVGTWDTVVMNAQNGRFEMRVEAYSATMTERGEQEMGRGR